MISREYWASDGTKHTIEAKDEDDVHRQMREIENYITKPKGLYEALCDLYGWDKKNRSPEDVIEAAWKAVPKYTWWRHLLYKFKRIFSFKKRGTR